MRALLLGLVLVVVPRAARAGEPVVVAPASVPVARDPPPPPPPPPLRPAPVERVAVSRPYAAHWDDRAGVTWEAGAGTWVGFRSRPGTSEVTDGAVSGMAIFGIHYLRRRELDFREGKQRDGGGVAWTRWCVHILCGGIGLFFMPDGLVAGNEWGVDARVVAGPGLARFSLAPVSRYSEGALRTWTFPSFFLPEAGVQYREQRGVQMALTWSFVPVDVRIGGGLALSLDLVRAGIHIGLDSPRRGGELGSEISLRFAP